MGINFKGVDSAGYGGYALTDQLLYNIKWWIDWGVLNNGAFDIFQRGQDSFYDDTEAELHSVQDERYVEGIVWEGAGREWVWESGISVTSGEIEPFRVSGIYFNGTFHSQASVSGGVLGHHIDYQNGRVIFDQPQNSNDIIEAEFTTRSVHVSFADNPEFKVIMLDALEEFEQDLSPSGTPAREHQAWLPAIFIEVGEGRQRGLQLGGGQIKTRIINLHIFADNPSDRNLLKDWLDFQSRTSFVMADLNNITWPFDRYGDIVPGITNWPNIAASFPGQKIRLQDATSRNLNSLNSRLFRARVTWEVEIDVGGI